MTEVDPSALPKDAILLVVSSLALKGFPEPVPYCQRRPCVNCGRDVWAAPSTVHAEKYRTVVNVCQSCAVAAADELGGFEHVGRLRGADEDVRREGSRVTSEAEARNRRDLAARVAPRRR